MGPEREVGNPELHEDSNKILRELSLLGIGDKCKLDFFISGQLTRPCFISSVKFTDFGKVTYDVAIPVIENEEGISTTTINDVDSAFIKPWDGEVTNCLLFSDKVFI